MTKSPESMILSELLVSLSDEERNFIANLDYGNDAQLHRKELDIAINNQGAIDYSKQHWHPYEVIELGRNWLQLSHEREFTACTGIVLKNIIEGTDRMNDVEMMLENHAADYDSLPPELKGVLDDLLATIIKKL